MSQTVLQHDEFPAEQFDDALQQEHASTLGMWTFLATEVLFFGVLFVSFYVLRLRFPADFAEGARHLKWYLGSANTAILLGSSFLMALAVHASSQGERKALVRWLMLTIALGIIFLAVKGVEYFLEYREQLVPAWHYSAIEPEPPHHLRPGHLPLFLTFYFIMTALHALHVIVGLGAMSVLLWLSHRGKFSREYHTPVEMVGLYWHFVDIVWVFLFPTLYLLRHP